MQARGSSVYDFNELVGIRFRWFFLSRLILFFFFVTDGSFHETDPLPPIQSIAWLATKNFRQIVD